MKEEQKDVYGEQAKGVILKLIIKGDDTKDEDLQVTLGEEDETINVQNALIAISPDGKYFVQYLQELNKIRVSKMPDEVKGLTK